MPIYYLTRTPYPQAVFELNLPVTELWLTGGVGALINYFYQNQGPFGPFYGSNLLGINKIDQPIYNAPGGHDNLYNVVLINQGFPFNTTQRYVRANSFTAAKDYTEVLSGLETNWGVISIINLGYVSQT